MKVWLRPLLAGATLAAMLTLVFSLTLFVILRGVIAELPRLPENPTELGIRPGTEIFASSGERIFTFNQTRQWAPLDQISPFAIQALIATEDVAFYQHCGVDIRAILGAIRANIHQGYGTRGGSTLTQQLVKRLFFSPEKTIRRKLSEILLTLQLEALYARTFPDSVTTETGTHPAYKDRLLELYLNTVFYGANAYGITDAAFIYFGRSPGELSLPQAALLMGLINAPTAYNPLQRPERASRRLRHVLRRMAQAGFLDADELAKFTELRAEELIDPHRAPRNPTPYWVEAIKAEVARRWGPEVLRYGSLQIHTTLDMDLQKAAEQAVATGVSTLDQRMGFKPYSEAPLDERKEYVQAALVCLDPHTGQVRAMVGGRDIFVSYFNRALTARRQPGSGFKPIAYLTALEVGAISPVSLFVDEPRSYEVNGELWEPRNFGDRYFGLTTAAWALIKSANSTAVQVTERAGPENIAKMAKRLGFQSEIGSYKSIALGVSEVTVLEMASAYGALATAGLHVEPTLVDRIVDAEGRKLFAHEPTIRRAVAPELAYQMVQLLCQVVDRGTGRRVRSAGFTRPAAGKTGTTNDNTDAWFTGFTPELATSVWVGFDDRKKHKLVDEKGIQITGGGGAAPIWAEFMKEATKGRPFSDFQRPDGVRLVEVDPSTGVSPEEPPAMTLLDTAMIREIPITVVLQNREAVNQPADVLTFESARERSLLDSLLKTGWERYPSIGSNPSGR